MPVSKKTKSLSKKPTLKKKVVRKNTVSKISNNSKKSTAYNSLYARFSEAVFWSGFFAAIGIAIAVFRDVSWALLRYVFNTNSEFNSYVVVLAPILGIIVLFSFLFEVLLRGVSNSKRSAGLMAGIALGSILGFVTILKF